MADTPIAVGTGSLSLTGETPRRPGFFFTGFPPTTLYDRYITPTTGSISFDGTTPFVVEGSITNTVFLLPTVSLGFTGYGSALHVQTDVLPSTSLATAGYSPTVTVSEISSPATASITFAGSAPARINVAQSGTSITNPGATTSVPSNYEQCDYTGFRQLPGSLKMTWNKHAVRKKSYEERHPQDTLRSIPEKQKGSRRPEQPDRFIEDIGTVDAEDL